MTAQQLLNAYTSLDFRSHSFSSASWLSYFQGNKSAAVDLTIPNEIDLPGSIRTPLIRSLQRFQIGESGDGKHLKRYAATLNDPIYEKCIDLFVKEEQSHAGMLARVITSTNNSLLSRHWSNLAFVALRRMLGLKTEVFVLLIAEIIGKAFYKTCADKLENRALKNAFTLIVLDQIFHLEFHSSFMCRQMLQYSQASRLLIYYCWSALFYAACLAFIVDHRGALQALNVSPKDFLKDCSSTFHNASVRILR